MPLASRAFRDSGALLRPIGKILAFLLAWLLLSVPFFMAAIWMGKRAGFGPSARLIADVGSAVTLFLTSWLFIRFVDRRAIGTSFLAADNAFLCSLGGAALGVLMMGAVAMIALLTGATQGMLGVHGRALLALTVFGLAFNVFAQEALFRGYIFSTMSGWAGSTTAVLVTTTLFVAAHGLVYQGSQAAVWQALNLVAAGILLGLTVAWTGSIWLACAAHFVWNAGQSILFGQQGAGYLAGYTGSILDLHAGTGIESTGAGLVGPLFGVFVLCVWRVRKRARGVPPAIPSSW